MTRSEYNDGRGSGVLTLWIAQGEPSDLVLLLLLLDALGRFMLALDAADALRIVLSHFVSLALRTRLDGSLAIRLLRATFACFGPGLRLVLFTVLDCASIAEFLLRLTEQSLELLAAMELVGEERRVFIETHRAASPVQPLLSTAATWSHFMDGAPARWMITISNCLWLASSH